MLKFRKKTDYLLMIEGGSNYLDSALIRMKNSRVVQCLDEDVNARIYSNYRVEVGRGIWKVSPEIQLGFREILFAKLIEQVSRHVRLGFFFHPNHMRTLEKHTFKMIRCLERLGWTVEFVKHNEVLVRMGERKATLSCKQSKGLMLAMAIFILLPHNA